MDGYEVLEKLGSGSFGTIRKVRRRADRKILVWKEIRYGRMNEKEKSMLVSEVNILRELKHPNIVRYKDRIIDRESATIFIVMEFCENGDLAAVIRKYKRSGKQMEEHKIWNILFQLTCALHECHSRKDKILHRDIKPANVFIDKHHNFKLGDFGLAKVLGAEHEFAKTNVGTPYYMAPEQVNEVPYNEKCDIWSLGCLVYELAAKAPPFEAHNQLALAVKIKAAKVQRLPDGFSDELNMAVRNMLQLDHTKRPSVQDLLRLPRMQEQAEVVLRGASCVPQPLLDRYFAAQMRRLTQKEDELSARAQELNSREKDLRGGGSGGNSEKSVELAKREADLLTREKEFEKREAEMRRREKDLEDARTAMDNRDTAASERDKAIQERERACTDRERRAEKAKQEYSLLFNELKRRKKAVDDQQRRLAVPTDDKLTSNNNDKLLRRCRSVGGEDTVVHDDCEAPDRRSVETEDENMHPNRARVFVEVESKKVESTKGRVSTDNTDQQRSPTPHPRQGYLFDAADAAEDRFLRRNANDYKRPTSMYGSTLSKRHAALREKAEAAHLRPTSKDTMPESNSEDDSAMPFNLHGRRMFAVPLTEELDSSVDSPPPVRRLVSAA